MGNVSKRCETIRARTPRSSGVSLKVTINRINPVLRGWFGCFPSGLSLRVEDKHASSGGLNEVDGFVRRRLRSILRQHHKRPGCSRHADHKRRPSKLFAELGLFSLETSHKLARQSMKMAR